MRKSKKVYDAGVVALLVRRIRAISPWAVLVGAFAFAIAFGIPWIAVGGLVAAAAVGGVNRVIGQRIEEYFARKPDLSLAIARGGQFVNTVEPAAPPPWPIDSDQIVEHAIEDLDKLGRACEKAARSPVMRLGMHGPFVTPPSENSYRGAREKFAAEVAEYGDTLGAWLADYSEAAALRARTFELSLAVMNGKSGIYAEDVELAIDLPTGVEAVATGVTMPPAAPPRYIAPKPASALGIVSPVAHLHSDLAAIKPSVSPGRGSLWRSNAGGRGLRGDVGDVHRDDIVLLDEKLLVRVPGEGRHSLTWTLRTKNAGRRHRTGVLNLVVRGADQRPPFTRLRGIERYPDVPFVDNGEIVREARTSDPPTEPPPPVNGRDLIEHVRNAVARREWLDLGLEVDAPSPGGG